MTEKPLYILITGKPASGKTTLLEKISKKYSCFIKGIISPASKRIYRSKKSAEKYFLKLTYQNKKYLWAEKTKDQKFVFHNENLKKTTENLKNKIKYKTPDCLILDDLGPLEIKKNGYYELFEELRSFPIKTFILSVKKRLLSEVIKTFSLNDALVIDLDEISQQDALKIINSVFEEIEIKKIGTYAGISGLTEVGLGSLLHLWNIPLKGHFLAYLQNAMFIIFGNELNGKGLFRIGLITSLLKIFSPMTNPLRPMLYIFLQSSLFAVSISILGWNILGVIIGSLLLNWFVLGISLLFDYIIFGISFFDALQGSINWIGGFLGFKSYDLLTIVGFFMVFKGFLSIIISLIFFYGKGRILLKIFAKKTHKIPINSSQTKNKSIFLSGLQQILNVKFIVFFLISILMIFFFTNISQTDFFILIARALLISYLGFIVTGKTDILKLVKHLDKKQKFKIEHSLYYALEYIKTSSESQNKIHK